MTVKEVRTSELVKLLTIPALGQYTNGSKFEKGQEPYFVKTFSGYKAKFKNMNFAVILSYESDDYGIAVSNSEDFDNIYLAAIKVHKQGQGLGTELMNKILDHCDKNNVKLYLHPFPLEYTKENFNAKKALPLFYRLRDWYKSFGFVEQLDGYMVYYPNSVKLD